jgi:hypothetical protein
MRLATIELEIPETGENGRVFLNRELLRETTVAILEKEFAATFVEPEDAPRMALIRQLLLPSLNTPIVVTVHPSEISPPEFHAFLKDPSSPCEPLFACVLAPMPVVAEMVAAAPQIVFETATFQAMAADTAPSKILAALEAWSRRMWPELPVPKFVLSS